MTQSYPQMKLQASSDPPSMVCRDGSWVLRQDSAHSFAIPLTKGCKLFCETLLYMAVLWTTRIDHFLAVPKNDP
jgi:hypothetical protein